MYGKNKSVTKLFQAKGNKTNNDNIKTINTNTHKHASLNYNEQTNKHVNSLPVTMVKKAFNLFIQ